MRCHCFNVPCRRRKETLALLLFNWPSTLLTSLGVYIYLIICGSTLSRTLMAVYTVWIIWMDPAPNNAGFRWQSTASRLWFRDLRIWKWLASYFPIKLVKTADLPADQKYIFGYHPHGILSEGAFISFLTNGTGFDNKFPGVDVRGLTLKSNLLTPFHREWALAHGCGVASRQCVSHCLNNDRSVLLVLGGAAEALDSKPGGKIELTLLKRRGFVRLALKHGANLVPVFAFGEQDLYEQVDNHEGTLLRRCQDWFKSKIGFAPPLVKGRGVFNLDFGVLPHRRPITTVVGSPIKVTQIENPTEDDVTKLHKEYVDALKALFEAHKKEYGATELSFKQ